MINIKADAQVSIKVVTVEEEVVVAIGEEEEVVGKVVITEVEEVVQVLLGVMGLIFFRAKSGRIR